jgi:hypothetical protein
MSGLLPEGYEALHSKIFQIAEPDYRTISGAKRPEVQSVRGLHSAEETTILYTVDI